MKSGAVPSGVWLIARMLLVVGVLLVLLPAAVAPGTRTGAWGTVLRYTPAMLCLMVVLQWAVHGKLSAITFFAGQHEFGPPVASLRCMVIGPLLIYGPWVLFGAGSNSTLEALCKGTVRGVGVAVFAVGLLAVARASLRARRAAIEASGNAH